MNARQPTRLKWKTASQWAHTSTGPYSDRMWYLIALQAEENNASSSSSSSSSFSLMTSCQTQPITAMKIKYKYNIIGLSGIFVTSEKETIVKWRPAIKVYLGIFVLLSLCPSVLCLLKLGEGKTQRQPQDPVMVLKLLKTISEVLVLERLIFVLAFSNMVLITSLIENTNNI